VIQRHRVSVLFPEKARLAGYGPPTHDWQALRQRDFRPISACNDSAGAENEMV
jgi:hypothetical protein